MSLAITIISAILAIFLVVLIHECGHFFVARWCGVKVLKFSIGFGKAIFSIRGKSGTTYAIGFLPLGGYVKMLGEDDEESREYDPKQAYNKKPVWQRMLIILAGPVTNFILAAIIFWAIFAHGVTHIKPVIGAVAPQSIAAKARLQPGDEILKIDNTQTRNWQHVLMALIMRVGDKGHMRVIVKPKTPAVYQMHVLSLANWKLDKRSPRFLQSLGITPYFPKVAPVVGKVLADSPAQKAGVMQGDRIVGLNGKRVSDWLVLLKQMKPLAGKHVRVTIDRAGVRRTLVVTLGARDDNGVKHGFLGVLAKPPKWPAQMRRVEKFSWWGAMVPAVSHVWMLTSFNGIVLYKMILGKISIKTLGGPIMVFRTAGQASQAGFWVYLAFIGFISATLGFINILPIPGLDGGHFLFQVIEVLRGKPVAMRWQILFLKIGIILLIFFMLQATLNDLLRLWG